MLRLHLSNQNSSMNNELVYQILFHLGRKDEIRKEDVNTGYWKT